MPEGSGNAIDHRHNAIPAGYREISAGAKIVLNIDDDQHVARSNFGFVSHSPALIETPSGAASPHCRFAFTYCHRKYSGSLAKNKRTMAERRMLARPAGLEPATVGLEGRCSIRLSYGRLSGNRDTSIDQSLWPEGW